MKNIIQIKSILRNAITIPKENVAFFFKTGAGQYAEHDQFIGVNVPTLRKIAKNFTELTTHELQFLIESKINEERLLALLILIFQYKQAGSYKKEEIYAFYLRNLEHINNWNLVDASAHLIVGAHLINSDKDILVTLAKSKVIWERRISIIATWYFIRNDDLEWTFKIARMLLNDDHDLIHKAVGWMLREAGKRDENQLIAFLNQYAVKMPRTMVRYSIEKLEETQRKIYSVKFNNASNRNR
jgi:3-methyladenine DNA glycosylase AlkD